MRKGWLRTMSDKKRDSARVAYARPSVTVVKLQPEERLMKCARMAGLPGDPCWTPDGSGYIGS